MCGIFPGNMGQVHIWRSSGQGHGNQKGLKFLFPQHTSIGYYSNCRKHGAIKFACFVGFLPTAHQLVWLPSLSHDQKWLRVTKCTPSRVVLAEIRRQCFSNLVWASFLSRSRVYQHCLVICDFFCLLLQCLNIEILNLSLHCNDCIVLLQVHVRRKNNSKFYSYDVAPLKTTVFNVMKRTQFNYSG